jgi:hypothetical protein
MVHKEKKNSKDKKTLTIVFKHPKKCIETRVQEMKKFQKEKEKKKDPIFQLIMLEKNECAKR